MLGTFPALSMQPCSYSGLVFVMWAAHRGCVRLFERADGIKSLGVLPFAQVHLVLQFLDLVPEAPVEVAEEVPITVEILPAYSERIANHLKLKRYSVRSVGLTALPWGGKGSRNGEYVVRDDGLPGSILLRGRLKLLRLSLTIGVGNVLSRRIA